VRFVQINEQGVFKMNFWNIFLGLCKDIDKAPNTVAKEIGISSGAITFWKKDERRPTPRMLKKIADYFGVTVNYLLGYEDKKEKTPGLSEGEELLLDLFRQVPEDKQDFVLQMIRLALGNQ
jgi:transcriptional regulator with XRE-family HTH domain